MRTNDNLVQFRRYGPLESAIAERGDNANAVVQRDIARYYAVLERELRTVALTECEALAVADALNGCVTDPPEMARLLTLQVSDAVRLDGLADKWEVDAKILVAKLATLSFVQTVAIVDAAERAWRQHDGQDMRLVLRAVGLVR